VIDMRKILPFVCAAIVIGACGSGSDGEAVQADTMCNPTSPAVDPVSMKPLFGSGAPGAACSKHTDCAALCCTCSKKAGVKFLASECTGGKCADMATACADEEKLVGAYVCP
jgi:hypothetical protein